MPIFIASQAQGWNVGRVEDGSVHVEPIGDLIEHEVVDCVCVPRVEPFKRVDGQIVWLLVHHALDNREAGEVA